MVWGERTAMPRLPRVVDDGFMYDAINRGDNRAAVFHEARARSWHPSSPAENGMGLE
jgi:hypothetical protein